MRRLACKGVGAGAGLSTAAGLTYSGARFERYFSDFAKAFGIRDMYSGGFYPFPAPEAARIAVETVRSWLAEDQEIERVVFDVWKDRDLEIYRGLLGQ